MKLSADDIRNVVKNIANNPDGKAFIEILLDKLGAFERGCNCQNVYQEYYNKGKKEQGLWLLDLLMESNFQVYSEILKQRRTIWQTNKLQQD